MTSNQPNLCYLHYSLPLLANLHQHDTTKHTTIPLSQPKTATATIPIAACHPPSNPKDSEPPHHFHTNQDQDDTFSHTLSHNSSQSDSNFLDLSFFSFPGCLDMYLSNDDSHVSILPAPPLILKADGNTRADWQQDSLALLPKPRYFPTGFYIGNWGSLPQGFFPRTVLLPSILGLHLGFSVEETSQPRHHFIGPFHLSVISSNGVFILAGRGGFPPIACDVMTSLSYSSPPVFSCGIFPTSHRVCPQAVVHRLARWHFPKYSSIVLNR